MREMKMSFLILRGFGGLLFFWLAKSSRRMYEIVIPKTLNTGFDYAFLTYFWYYELILFVVLAVYSRKNKDFLQIWIAFQIFICLYALHNVTEIHVFVLDVHRPLQ